MSKAVPLNAGSRAPRRELLAGLLGMALAACGGNPVVPQGVPELPDRQLPSLTELLTAAGLKWLLRLQPAAWWQLPWLQPMLRRLLDGERLDALELLTAIDLRRCPELALASYPSSGVDGALAYVVRHPQSQALVERRFRQRLTAEAQRKEHGHQLISVTGRVGSDVRGLALLGKDVACFQFGGELRRGPMRVASLYAEGKLQQIPTSLRQPALQPLDQALADQPLQLLWSGPFEGDEARGARGLLATATGVALGLAPAERGVLSLQLLIAGDYGEADKRAAAVLAAAWRDLVQSDLGHLLGLQDPPQHVQDPSGAALDAGVVIDVHPLGLQLRAAIDAQRLVDGLAAATVDSVREMMQADSLPLHERP